MRPNNDGINAQLSAFPTRWRHAIPLGIVLACLAVAACGTQPQPPYSYTAGHGPRVGGELDKNGYEIPNP